MMHTDSELDMTGLPPFLSETTPSSYNYFDQLYDFPVSFSLSEVFDEYVSAKPRTHAIFIEGIVKFTVIANLSSEERTFFYGHQFLGLYYPSNITALWNSISNETMYPSSFYTLAPKDWVSSSGDGSLILIYNGSSPSRALNQLIKGPTVIDCGMFCQLGIWFGIRYMLGDAPFDEIFGRQPFVITQYLFNGITDEAQPYAGFTLYPFHSHTTEININKIQVFYATNCMEYQLKHPGGECNGEHCLILNGGYYIFDPGSGRTQSLDRSTINHLLLQAFNQEQDSNDAAQMALFRSDPDRIHNKNNMRFSDLECIAHQYRFAQTTMDFLMSTQEHDSLRFLTFELDLFLTWLDQLKEGIQEELALTSLPESHQLESKNKTSNYPRFVNYTSNTFNQLFFKAGRNQHKSSLIQNGVIVSRIIEIGSQTDNARPIL